MNFHTFATRFMFQMENLTVRVHRDSFRIPPDTAVGSKTSHKPLILLPIESKSCPSYRHSPVGRTTSTDSTDTSLTPTSRRLVPPQAVLNERFILERPSSGSTIAKKRVSWAPISHVKVIVAERSPSGYTRFQGNLDEFDKTLKNSPKHVDTIYIYQSAPPLMDFDYEIEEDSQAI